MRLLVLIPIMLLCASALGDSCVKLVNFTSCPPSNDATTHYEATVRIESDSEPASFDFAYTVLFRKPGYRGYETLHQSATRFHRLPKVVFFLMPWEFTQPGIYVLEAQADPECPGSICADPPCNRDQCEVSWRVAEILVPVELRNYTFTGPVRVRAELFDRVTGENCRPAWVTQISGSGTINLEEAPFGTWKLRIATPGGQWLSRVQDVVIDQRTYTAPPFSLRNGDANRDGCVDLADLSFVLLRFAQTGGPADLDNDGLVGVPDLAIILVNFGRCSE